VVRSTDFGPDRRVDVTIERTKHEDSRQKRTQFLVDLPADGAILTDRSEAYFIATADCPVGVLVLRLTDGAAAAIAFHASRDCLINRHRLMGTDAPEGVRDETIVSSVVRAMASLRPVQATLHFVHGICGEHFAHHFNDPVNGERHRRTADFLTHYYDVFPGEFHKDWFQLDLIALVRQQFCRHGLNFGEGEVIGGCTLEDTRLYSARRVTEETKPNIGRNGVLISLL
jgi:copper oxidase (laccase) domain-containing protein